MRVRACIHVSVTMCVCVRVCVCVCVKMQHILAHPVCSRKQRTLADATQDASSVKLAETKGEFACVCCRCVCLCGLKTQWWRLVLACAGTGR